MTQPVYARWAGRLLGSHVEEAPRVEEHERDAAIHAIERAIRERGRRRSRTRWAIGVCAVAAAVAGIGIGAQAYRAPRLAGGTATTTTTATTTGAAAESDAPLTITATASGLGATISSGPGSVFALTNGDAADSAHVAHVATGHHIVARGRSRATLAFSTGTELTVENGGDLAVVEEGRSQIFALDAGDIRARVAKLRPGERFVVRTPDAEVEVRGTSFSVAIASADPSCGDGSVTRVTVDEGVGVVRRGGTETRVGKGEEWPAGCDASIAGVGAGGTGASLGANAGSSANGSSASNPSSPSSPASGRHSPRREAAAAPLSASSLAEQNDLFAEALAYKNGGQRAAAVAAFERFVAKYPSSNLAENAAVERMKLLLADDPPRGVAAARSYLRRYPNGFAQREARAAVTGAP